MEKKKQEFALLMFFGWLLIAASLITSSEGSMLRDIVQGIMTGGGIGIMLLALWMFRKNNGFKSKK
ncbi:hypothetical protein [Paenibacillus sp. FSL H8-0259]|jgi:hypothetical protein|uniref:hypothetical protein n=1 Tax=Paenibacillus sp. FSL H8-0259 TaxID=1920423 RepID=UPI00096E706C|nr:hypothetical protein [Paenibacillus sp. FSL H8-0259]OMF24592.1 hypothetical protein BK132_23300 [Paenibacillus sp. FSL H8-0259]